MGINSDREHTCTHTHTYTHIVRHRERKTTPYSSLRNKREKAAGEAAATHTHTHTHTAEIMHKQSKIRSGSSGELKEMKLEAAREPAAKFQNSKKGRRTPREVRR